MKKHLELLRALVAFVALGKTASLSLQAPLQAQQSRLGSRELGPGVTGNPGGGFDGGVAGGSGGLFRGTVDQSQSGGLSTQLGESFGRGGGAANLGGFPGGSVDSLGAAGRGFGISGSDSNGDPGSGGLAGGGGFVSAPGSGGRDGFLSGLTSPAASAQGVGRSLSGVLGSGALGGILGGPGRASPGPGALRIPTGSAPGGPLPGGPGGISGSTGTGGSRRFGGPTGLLGTLGSSSGPASAVGNVLSSVGNLAGSLSSGGVGTTSGPGQPGYGSGGPGQFGGRPGPGGSASPGGVPGLPGTLGPSSSPLGAVGNVVGNLGSLAGSFGTGGVGTTSGSGQTGTGQTGSGPGLPLGESSGEPTGMPGARGSLSGPVGAIGLGPGRLGSPGAPSLGSGVLGSASGPRPEISGSGTGGGTFATPESSSGSSFGNMPGSSMNVQPGLGTSTNVPSGRGFESGSIGASDGRHPSSGGSSGAGGAGGSAGPVPSILPGAGGALTNTRLTVGGSRRHRPGLAGTRRKPNTAEATAIGLGVLASALAAGAIGAGIAGALNRNRPRGIGGARIGCSGCIRQPCVSGCGRKRRSIPKSKVPADILDSIPTNFERLY